MSALAARALTARILAKPASNLCNQMVPSRHLHTTLCSASLVVSPRNHIAGPVSRQLQTMRQSQSTQWFAPPKRPITRGEWVFVTTTKGIVKGVAATVGLIAFFGLCLVVPGALPSDDLLERMSKLSPTEADALYEREHAPIVPGPYR